MMKKFDIVIPVGPADIISIEKVVNYTRKNIIGYNKIYLISSDASLKLKNCITIDENIAPFTKENIRSHFRCQDFKDRCGWYYQQLLKFYAFKMITDLLDDFLIMDADVYFLKPTKFLRRIRLYWLMQT